MRAKRRQEDSTVAGLISWQDSFAIDRATGSVGLSSLGLHRSSLSYPVDVREQATGWSSLCVWLPRSERWKEVEKANIGVWESW